MKITTGEAQHLKSWKFFHNAIKAWFGTPAELRSAPTGERKKRPNDDCDDHNQSFLWWPCPFWSLLDTCHRWQRLIRLGQTELSRRCFFVFFYIRFQLLTTYSCGFIGRVSAYKSQTVIFKSSCWSYNGKNFDLFGWWLWFIFDFLLFLFLSFFLYLLFPTFSLPLIKMVLEPFWGLCHPDGQKAGFLVSILHKFWAATFMLPGGKPPSLTSTTPATEKPRNCCTAPLQTSSVIDHMCLFCYTDCKTKSSLEPLKTGRREHKTGPAIGAVPLTMS